MILETVRCVADWLAGMVLDYQSASQSVNTLLAGVPRDGSDPLPGNVTVADETRSSVVAWNDIPATLPALLVSVAEVAPFDGGVMTTIRDGEVKVLLRYAAENSTTADGNRDAYYTLRAVERSLRQLNRNENLVVGRTRNSAALIECKEIVHVPLWDAREDRVITGALLVTYRVRDSAP